MIKKRELGSFSIFQHQVGTEPSDHEDKLWHYYELAASLIPALRKRAQETTNLRQLTEATVRDLIDSGLIRLFTPKYFGGFEAGWERQLIVTEILARGCASTAWVYMVSTGNAWILGRFPKQAQCDVWGETPDVILAAAMAGAGEAKPFDDGYVLSGRWRFSA